MTTEINNIQYRDDCVKWTWVTALLYVAPDQTDTVLYQCFTYISITHKCMTFYLYLHNTQMYDLLLKVLKISKCTKNRII
jgi:hypothetical protein